MSEFVLTYFEVNNSKYKIKNVSRNMETLAKQIESQAKKLDNQSGFGVSGIRRELNKIGRKCRAESEKALLLHDFLDVVADKTREADQNAANILKDFSIRHTEHVLEKALKDALALFNIITGFIQVPWGKALINIYAKSVGGGDLDGIFEKGTTELIKQLEKYGGKKWLESLIGKTQWGGSVVSWAVNWIEDIYQNITDGDGTVKSDIIESLSEGGIGAILTGIGVLIGAGVVAAVGAEGAVAAAIVGGIGIVVNWAADLISEAVFDNELGLVENMGDIVCDWIGEMGIAY